MIGSKPGASGLQFPLRFFAPDPFSFFSTPPFFLRTKMGSQPRIAENAQMIHPAQVKPLKRVSCTIPNAKISMIWATTRDAQKHDRINFFPSLINQTVNNPKVSFLIPGIYEINMAYTGITDDMSQSDDWCLTGLAYSFQFIRIQYSDVPAL